MEESSATSSRDSVLLSEKSRATIRGSWLTSTQPQWSSRYKGFLAYVCVIMSYLSAIKFCGKLGNHKVTMFIPYLVFNIFVGVPAVLVEIMLGRFVMGNLSKVWSMCVPTRGVFWCLVLITFFLTIVNYIYNIYLLKYFFGAFHVEWKKCDKSWNKINCYQVGRKSEALMKCLKNHSDEFCHKLNWETAQRQYWKYRIQNTSELEVCLSLLYLAFSVVVVSVIIYKGILSLEKVLTLLVYPSTVLWTILVVVCFNSDSSVEGFKALFHFSWHDLIQAEVWVEGLQDTLYLIGLGRLSLSFISSHGNFTDNILIDVAIVTFTSIVTCVLKNIPILTLVANVKYINEGITDGPFFKDVTDIFVTISEAMVLFPYPTSLWSSLYYLDCYIVSLSSQAILVLALCKALEGVLNKNKCYFYIVLAVSTVSFIVAASLQYVQIIREVDYGSIIVAVIVLCTISWQLFYGIGKFNSDYYFMMGYPLPMFLKFTWIALLVVMVMEIILKLYYELIEKPMKNILVVYFGVPMFVYFFVILIYMVKFRMQKISISKVFAANPNWGPENVLLKKSRVFFEKSLVTREFMYRQELYKKPFIKPPDFSDQNIVTLV